MCPPYSCLSFKMNELCLRGIEQKPTPRVPQVEHYRVILHRDILYQETFSQLHFILIQQFCFL